MRNRAILADIHELNLDPTRPHTTTKSNGRLGSRVVEKQHAKPHQFQKSEIEVKVTEPEVTKSTSEIEETTKEMKTAEVDVQEKPATNEEPKVEKKRTRKTKDSVTQ